MSKWFGRRGAKQANDNAASAPRAAARPCVGESLESRLLFTVPAGFTETEVLGNLASPTHMTVAPDGRIFISQKNGALRVYKNGSLKGTPFLTVTVNTFGERGLQGIAFDPDFATNNYVYVFYTSVSPNVHNRVSRFTANGDVAVPGSEVVLLDIPPSSSVNHNGGSLAFGPDGKLYVGVGDDSTPANGQSLGNVRGKVLRINTDGSIPTDNPHYNETTGISRAIWARGFRNPFQFDFQPGTGKMYINDVGPGEVEPDANTWEEVNEGVAGGNYGWAGINGFRTNQTAPPNYRDPVYAYNHLAEGLSRAITGGVFYNPPAAAAQPFPSEYHGKYFFAELTGGYVKSLDGATGIASPFATSVPYIVDMELAADGGLYYLSFGTTQSTGSNAGRLVKVSYTGSSVPDIGTQPQNKTVSPGEPATFSITASGAGPLSYQWQRNGQDIPGANASSYTLTNPQFGDNGATFRCVVSNSGGADTSDPATLTVTSNQAPVPVITTPLAGTTVAAGQTLTFAGSATDPEDGVLGAASLVWGVDYFTGAVSRPLVDPTPGAGGTFAIPTLSPYRRPDVFYRVYLIATDSQGRTTTVTRDLQPQLATITLRSSIPGLGLTLDGQAVADGSAFQSVVGLTRSIGAPAVQAVGGVTYEFVGWSDGGAADHEIATPGADATYTAVYQQAVGTDPDPTDPAGPDLTAVITGKKPTALVAGSRGKATARITNQGPGELLRTELVVRFYASTDGVLDPTDTVLASVTRVAKLKAGKSKLIPAKFDYPEPLSGDYVLLAKVDADNAVVEAVETNNAAVGTTVTVSPPVVNFTGEFRDNARELLPLAPGQLVNARAVLSNTGNVRFDGELRLRVYATTNPAAGVAGAAALLADLTPNVKLSAEGGTHAIALKFEVPGTLPAGSYYLLVAIDPLDAVVETDELDNVFSNTPVV